ISVLVLFAIMLTQTKAAPARLVFQTQALPAAIAAAVLGILIALTVGATNWNAVSAPIRTGTAILARVLFDQFVLPFEIVSVLLLAAVIAGILFSIGTFGFLARRNAISMLMSIELMINAVNLTIIAFGAFIPTLKVQGSVIALIVLAVAAAEATVGLSIVIAIYRNRKTPLVDEYDTMRD